MNEDRYAAAMLMLTFIRQCKTQDISPQSSTASTPTSAAINSPSRHWENSGEEENLIASLLEESLFHKSCESWAFPVLWETSHQKALKGSESSSLFALCTYFSVFCTEFEDSLEKQHPATSELISNCSKVGKKLHSYQCHLKNDLGTTHNPT